MSSDSRGGDCFAIATPGFSKTQLKRLTKKLDSARIQVREMEGKNLSYIEGWYAVAQANAIFGYQGWDRETVHLERIYERTKAEATACSYLARVRITVRAGNTVIIREGTGCGWALDRNVGAAHEKALKTAETDATKRALATFGSQFGLTLYDKEQTGAADKCRPTLTLFAPDGKSLSDKLSPEAYCSGLRQLIHACRTRPEIDELLRSNTVPLSDLRGIAPRLCNSQGVHFADLLLRLMQRARHRLSEPVSGAVELTVGAVEAGSEARKVPDPEEDIRIVVPFASIFRSLDPSMDVGCKPENVPVESRLRSAPYAFGVELAEDKESKGTPISPTVARAVPPSIPLPQVLEPSNILANAITDADVPLASSKIAPGPRIDKSKLAIAAPRRIRDKAYLKQIHGLPCTICGRQPSHAHHLRFAQARGLSQKVSDEYVVPLCGLHHGDLHHSSDELRWWKKHKIDPVPIAAEMWERYRRPIV